MNLQDLKNLLRRYNLRPNFTFGQNFLIDDDVLKDIVETADISSRDQILEIGPGIGNLTRKLCERAGFVLSIEKDPKFLPVLRSIKKDFPRNFRFEIADALEFDFQKVLHESIINSQQLRVGFQTNDYSLMTNYPYKVVANIPYYITGKILEMLMTHLRKSPTSAGEKYRGASSEALAKEDGYASAGAASKPYLESITILAQKEVAQRICAAPGELSVLAISVQIYGEPKIIRTVSKNCFHPAPKVDSAILKIKVHQEPRFEIGDEKRFFRVVKACFTGKRKQIHNTLVNNLKLDKDQVAKILLVLKINPAARPQELGIGQWISLAEKLF